VQKLQLVEQNSPVARNSPVNHKCREAGVLRVAASIGEFGKGNRDQRKRERSGAITAGPARFYEQAKRDIPYRLRADRCIAARSEDLALERKFLLAPDCAVIRTKPSPLNIAIVKCRTGVKRQCMKSAFTSHARANARAGSSQALQARCKDAPNRKIALATSG